MPRMKKFLLSYLASTLPILLQGRSAIHGIFSRTASLLEQSLGKADMANKSKYPKYPMYYIEWKDHWGGGGGWNKKTDPEALICCSVGFIVDENKEGILMCGSRVIEESLTDAPLTHLKFIM